MIEALSREEARRHLLAQVGLARAPLRGKSGVRKLLGQLGCIQLDPLDAIGTNADLVALARVDGIARGDVYRYLLPGHAFEHFAKERCLLPAEAFPRYRDRATETPWWRLSERHARLPKKVVERVLDEVRARGPITARDLTDHGGVEPIDWGGWKGTSKATSMALEVLWTRCEVVIAGRTSAGKLYDVPERALPDVHDAPPEEFARASLLARVQSAGLLARAGGACWSMLAVVRKSGLVDALVEEGALVDVRIEGSTRPYLAPHGLRRRGRARIGSDGDRMRILGPLDPLIWDRKLVRELFDFDYVWEVYKPKTTRRFGWYVCPLLHRGALVGRLEAHVEGTTLVVDHVWREKKSELDEAALDACLARHAEACGCDAVKRARKIAVAR